MTPPSDLAKCAHCNCWFAAAADDEVFHHATQRCRREEPDAPDAAPHVRSSAHA
jgi:hypothetical protein